MTSTTTQSIDALKANILERIAWGNWFVDAIFAQVSDEQMMARAGGAGNHPLWVLGHLTHTKDSMISMFNGSERVMPEAWDPLFGGGTTSLDDRSAYPSRAEIETATARVREKLTAWVASMDETTAYAPAPEPMRPFAPDAITAASSFLAHDFFHLGQVASVRSSLGLKPAVV